MKSAFLLPVVSQSHLLICWLAITEFLLTEALPDFGAACPEYAVFYLEVFLVNLGLADAVYVLQLLLAHDRFQQELGHFYSGWFKFAAGRNMSV
ncbi:hypothetical protein [Janthinobacterium sp. 64]|uniref:hypothetical protein n=1 Tax=Janthinobacterium sp. 64 TaxID=2035208 RepID=UPI0012FE7712|nr:hypothetical protein [Janthinobacterium sp. 64]